MGIVDVLSAALSVAALPVLGVALVLQLRRGRSGGAPHPMPTPVALGCMGFVAVVAVVAFVAGQRAEVTVGSSVTITLALVLACVLLRSDARWWVAFAVLTVVYAVAGALILSGLSHNVTGSSGGAVTGRLLVAWVGPNGNPESPRYGSAFAYLALARYGLPLGAMVSLSWVVASRRSMTRLERGGLLLLVGALVSETVVGATLSLVSLLLVALYGVPVAVALPGIVAALFMLFTVGPGAVTGIISGGAQMRQGLSGADAARSLVTVLGAGGAELQEDPERPTVTMRRYLLGNVGWVQKLNLVLIALFMLLVGGSVAIMRSEAGGSDQEEYRFEYVDREIALGPGLRRAFPDADGTPVVVTRDGRLLRLDLADGSVEEGDRPVQDAAVLGDALVLVTDEATPRVVVSRPAGDDQTVAELTPGARGSVVVVGEVAIVGDDAGRLVSVLADGSVAADASGSPVEHLAVHGDRVWSIHPGDGSARAVVELDPLTLEGRGLATTSTSADGALVWPGAPAFEPSFEVFESESDAYRRAFSRNRGVLVVGEGDLAETYYFHYDRVLARFDHDGETWLVTADQGLALTPRVDPAGYLVRWPGASS